MQLEIADFITKDEVTHKAESYTGLYGLHKYWGKKPYNVMANFIKKYTREGDVVLDPFCGSGVSISEAVFNGRKGVGVDINPMSILITSQVIKRVDTKRAIAEFKSIDAAIKEKINTLYSVIRDGNVFVGENFLWENEILTEVRYNEGKRRRTSERPQLEDFQRAQNISYNDIDLFFPSTNFYHNSRINAYKTKKIFELFTPRNLYALSLLLEQIEQIKDHEIRDFFSFCFTSAIGQASKMVFVIKRRNKTKVNGADIVEEKKEIGSWVIGYWAPKEYFENNVWSCFDNRFKKIIKAKQYQEKKAQRLKEGKKIGELKIDADFVLVNEPSQVYLKEICENSIDYILTDPPMVIGFLIWS